MLMLKNNHRRATHESHRIVFGLGDRYMYGENKFDFNLFEYLHVYIWGISIFKFGTLLAMPTCIDRLKRTE